MKSIWKSIFSLIVCAIAVNGSANGECSSDCYGQFTVHADWLFWKPCTENSFVGIEASFNSTPDVRVNKTKGFDHDTTSGFRLGFGYRPAECCEWDIGLNWINFSADTKGKILREKLAGDSVGLAPPFGSQFITITGNPLNTFFGSGNLPVQSFNEVHTKWNLDLNVVDFELGYKFCVGECFTLRPNASLRYLSLEQKVHSLTTGSGIGSQSGLGTFQWDQKFKSDFDGIGPRFGFDSIWNFDCGIGVFGDAAVSLLYGDADSKWSQFVAPVDSEEGARAFTKSSGKCVRPVTDIAIGVIYASDTCGYDYDIKLGWEHHYFFNQGAFDFLEATVINGNGQNSGFSTQGLTLGLGVSF